MRLAHGWSQSDAANAWNRRWPDSPRTFKNFSYWENWPGPTGHAPSLVVLDALARIYECSVADLVCGWGDHGESAGPSGTAEPETLAWQVRNLDLNELVHAVSIWSRRMPEDERRAGLLKLGTAAAAAAIDEPARPGAPGVTSALTNRLVGPWVSTYVYPSTSRGAVFESSHVVDLRPEDGRLVGRSRPDETGSELTLSLSVDGTLITGHWMERTSPQGHYRAAVYSGLLHLVIDPTASTMDGRWLGVGKRYTVKTGEWRLERSVQLDGSPGPETTTTTVEDSNSPSATRR